MALVSLVSGVLWGGGDVVGEAVCGVAIAPIVVPYTHSSVPPRIHSSRYRRRTTTATVVAIPADGAGESPPRAAVVHHAQALDAVATKNKDMDGHERERDKDMSAGGTGEATGVGRRHGKVGRGEHLLETNVTA
jgi:hypothetical protein